MLLPPSCFLRIQHVKLCNVELGEYQYIYIYYTHAHTQIFIYDYVTGCNVARVASGSMADPKQTLQLSGSRTWGFGLATHAQAQKPSKPNELVTRQVRAGDSSPNLDLAIPGYTWLYLAKPALIHRWFSSRDAMSSVAAFAETRACDGSCWDGAFSR